MAKRKKSVKAYPAPASPGKPIPGWSPHKNTKEVTCRCCGHEHLIWSWNFRSNKPHLVNKYGEAHDCPTPMNTHDVFPGWCEKCPATDLVYRRMKDCFELTESYGLPHACEQSKIIRNMKKAKCHHCTTPDLFWIEVAGRYQLTHPDGSKHLCPNYPVYMKDWAEGLRMNYAIEKAWIKSHPDGHQCKKCEGKSYTTFLSKNKRTMQKYNSADPITMHRPCLKCKRIGTFTAIRKADYLKDLRKKYWPFRDGVHKWKKYGRD